MKKIEKHMPLKDEIAQTQGVGEIVVITVAVGVLGAVPTRFQKFSEGN